ncbi:MAG: TlpA family protein disulfide reductase [Bacteroidales bacterium]|nr:TlpA family protein disulfide reductase [Bacteroidales bacterium]
MKGNLFIKIVLVVLGCVWAALGVWARNVYVHGHVADADQDEKVIISPYGNDIRIIEPIVMDVVNGEFNGNIESTDTVAMELIFYSQYQSGCWINHIIFTDSDTITINFPNGIDEDEEILGGCYNTRYQEDHTDIEEMEYSNSHANPLSAFYLEKKVKRLIQNWDGTENSKSIPHELITALEFNNDVIPNHPSIIHANQGLKSIIYKKEGTKLPNFSVVDLDGIEHYFYDLIKGKYIFLDLWASWCGPCRRHSVAMIPVYEKFKDQGFQVIAVARESENTKAMEKAMEQDGYPWASYVDLNDAHRVWAEFGVDSQGGFLWLLDSKGEILLVNPTADEVEIFLENHINQEEGN